MELFGIIWCFYSLRSLGFWKKGKDVILFFIFQIAFFGIEILLFYFFIIFHSFLFVYFGDSLSDLEENPFDENNVQPVTKKQRKARFTARICLGMEWIIYIIFEKGKRTEDGKVFMF